MGLGDNNFDYLLKANTPAITGPLDMARSGATLAQLLQGNQKTGLELDAMRQQVAMQQQPAFWDMISNVVNGGGAAGGSPVDTSLMSKFPAASGNALQTILSLQKNVGDIAKTQADAAKARNETLDTHIKWLSNLAGPLSENPTPAGFQGYLRLYQMSGLPPDALGAPPQSPEDVGPYLKGVAALGATPEQRSKIIQTYTELGPNIAQKQAETEASQAAAAKSRQDANLALGGNIITDKNTGDQYQMTLRPGANGQPPTVKPVLIKSGADAAPPKTYNVNVNNASASDIAGMVKDITANSGAPSPLAAPTSQPFRPEIPAAKATLLNKAADNAADLESRIPAANQALRTLDNMQQVAGNGGIFAGPIKGSDFFKQIAGVISQLPGASDDLRAKVSNTQVWDQQGGEFLLNTLGEMKGTVPRSQAAMQAIRNIKPNTLMTPQAQQQVIDYLRQTFDAQIQWAGAAAKGIREGKTLSEVEPPMGKQPGAVTVNKDGSYTMTVQ